VVVRSNCCGPSSSESGGRKTLSIVEPVFCGCVPVNDFRAFPRRFLKNVEIMTETYCGTKQNRSNHRLQKDLTKSVGVSWKHFGEHPW
jgi:hypothetical protein